MPQKGPPRGGRGTPPKGVPNHSLPRRVSEHSPPRSPSPLGDDRDGLEASFRAPSTPPIVGSLHTSTGDHCEMDQLKNQVGTLTNQVGELLAFFRAQAAQSQSVSPPPPTFAALAAHPDSSSQARREFRSAMNSVTHYAGQFDEAMRATYPTPYAFTQKVESIRERIPGGLVDDATLIGAGGCQHSRRGCAHLVHWNISCWLDSPSSPLVGILQGPLPC